MFGGCVNWSFPVFVYVYCWLFICWRSFLLYGIASFCCSIRSFRCVRSWVLVSFVNFMPCVFGMFWFWISSRIGSPMPVWSMRVFWMLSFCCACFRCWIICV